MKTLLFIAILKASGIREPSPNQERDLLTIATLIEDESTKYRVDPFLSAAIAANESRFDVQAVSADGKDFGPFQLRLGGAGGTLTRRQLLDVPTNVRVGVAYFAGLVDRCGGVRKALGAYNLGHCRQKTPARRKHARAYASRVFETYRALRRSAEVVSFSTFLASRYSLI